MAEELDQTDGIGGKHGQARRLAEKAVAEQAAGNDEEADRLFAEAERVDPSAVEAVLRQGVVSRQPPAEAQDDDEIAAMSRTIEPGHSPSRAGVSGRGSGADDE